MSCVQLGLCWLALMFVVLAVFKAQKKWDPDKSVLSEQGEDTAGK